jgi:phosphate/sulfate permease
VHWSVVRNMGLAWLITMPVSAALGVLALELWRLVT